KKVAPFRSSYDTASYLGCLRAVGFPRSADSGKDIVAHPPDPKATGAKLPPNGYLLVPKANNSAGMPVRLYVVGRQGAYELTLRDGDPVEKHNRRLEPWVRRDGRPWLFLGVAVVVGLLLYPVSREWQGFLSWDATPAQALVARLRGRQATSPAVV